MKEKLFNLLIMLPFIWLFSGLVFFKNGDKLIVVLILISIIATLFNYGLHSIKRNIHDKGLWIVIVMVAYAIFSYYYHGSSSREMRALLGATVLLFVFPRNLITKNVLKWLILLGSIAILFSTYYFSVHLRLARVQWPINAIPHATMGAVIAILALTLLLNEKKNRDRRILSFCLILSVAAVVINQTRGVWLSLIVASIIILLPKLKHINWKYALITVFIFFITVYIARPQIQQRINETQAEMTTIKSGDLSSSIGLRLQMWTLAPKLIEKNPILGSGNGHKDIFNALNAQGYISSELMEFSPAHYHNQYIDRLIKGGVIGLVLLLAIFTYPVVVATSGINQQISIGIVSIYAIASLTDVPFNHGPSFFMYLLLIFSLKLKNDEANC